MTADSKDHASNGQKSTRATQSRNSQSPYIGQVPMRSIKKTGTIPVGDQLRKIFFNSWLHVLLVLIPAGFAIKYTRQSPVAIFFVNFAAMIPSIMVLSIAIESILVHVGDTLGGFLAIIFSNIALLITSILLLISNQILVLQISLVGAILSNLLLMPGLAFLLGGLNRNEQYYNFASAHTTGEMLLLTITSLLIASVATRRLPNSNPNSVYGGIEVSRGASVLLLLSYGSFVMFQFKTHRDTFIGPPSKDPKKANTGNQPPNTVRSTTVFDEHTDEESEEAELPLLTAALTLLAFTGLLTYNTLFATDSIQGLLLRLDLNPTFLGIVVIPIISNDPATVVVGTKDRMDLMLTLTYGRCIQIGFLVSPFLVLLGWFTGIKMTLMFGDFQTLVIFAGILLVNSITQSGKSHWLRGLILVVDYVIVSIGAWYYPAT